MAAACGGGNGEGPPDEQKVTSRITPAPERETLTRYREKGIEPRRAQFAREVEE